MVNHHQVGGPNLWSDVCFGSIGNSIILYSDKKCAFDVSFMKSNWVFMNKCDSCNPSYSS